MQIYFEADGKTLSDLAWLEGEDAAIRSAIQFYTDVLQGKSIGWRLIMEEPNGTQHIISDSEIRFGIDYSK